MGKQLRKLEKLRRDWDSRGDVIRQARADGEQWEDIAKAIGLSRQTVNDLAKKSQERLEI